MPFTYDGNGLRASETPDNLITCYICDGILFAFGFANIKTIVYIYGDICVSER